MELSGSEGVGSASLVGKGFAVALLIVFISCATGCPILVPPPATLGYPGSLPCKRWETTYGNNVPITVYYPDTMPRMRNLPVVIFSSGWNQPRGAYSTYGEQLAQWGYVAIVQSYPSLVVGGIGLVTPAQDCEMQDEQIVLLIDWSAAENMRPESPLYGMVDPATAGTAGHSFGGMTAVRAALRDSRIKAVVDLDNITESPNVPVSDRLKETNAVFMWVGTDQGCLCSGPRGPDAPYLFDRAKPPTIEVIIRGAAHIDFLEQSPGLYAFGQIACGGGATDKNEVRAIAMRYMIAWFNAYLKGLSGDAADFNGPRARHDVFEGRVSIRANIPKP